MSIITISRGSYCRGREIAEKVAQALDYQCVSREILLEASEQFHVPEAKLLLAVRDAPSVFDRLSRRKEMRIACVRTALLEHVQRDNVVYHGLAGHILLQNVPGVLKVRINADLADRTKLLMRRHHCTTEEAHQMIGLIDEQRRKWTQQLYGADPGDPQLYDMVMHTRNISTQDAVETIIRAAKLPAFQTTARTMAVLEELAAESAPATA